MMPVNALDSNKISQLRSKYPDRIPILVKKAHGTKEPLPDMDRHKFLVPHEYTMNSLLYVVRKRLPQLQPHQALFLFVNDHTIVPAHMNLLDIYTQYRSEDGLLRFTYALENTFGSAAT